ncbi:hypothetical protein OH77DRAFT_514018 [Trametes cingulata]|nr:hypothetical protein OH77DRAFT_514018 [Trametes cingulata]
MAASDIPLNSSRPTLMIAPAAPGPIRPVLMVPCAVTSDILGAPSSIPALTAQNSICTAPLTPEVPLSYSTEPIGSIWRPLRSINQYVPLRSNACLRRILIRSTAGPRAAALRPCVCAVPTDPRIAAPVWYCVRQF